MSHKIWFLVGIFLVFSMGINITLADVTEIETKCGLFDCYTLLETDLNLPIGMNNFPQGVIEGTQAINGLSNSEFLIHKGTLRNINIEIIDKHTMNISGSIGGASTNLWGATILGDNSFAHSTWWNSSYDRCANITIVGDSVNLTDYQTKIEINSTDLYNDGYLNLNGSDVRIVNTYCSNNGTSLNWYNSTPFNTDNTFIWFRSNTTAGTNTTYSIYYDNPNATDIRTNATDIRGVVSNGDTVALFHCNEGSGNTVDTTDTYTLTKNANALWGTGMYDNYINSNNIASGWLGDDWATFETTRPFTLEAWIRFDGSTTAWQSGIIKSVSLGGSTNSYYIGSSNTNKIDYGHYASAFKTGIGTDAIDTSAWYHVAVVFNATGNFLYVNGTYDTSYTDDTSDPDYNNGKFQIGSRADGNELLNISVDELMLSDAQRTLINIRKDAEYYTLNTYLSTPIVSPYVTTTTTILSNNTESWDFNWKNENVPVSLTYLIAYILLIVGFVFVPLSFAWARISQ